MSRIIVVILVNLLALFSYAQVNLDDGLVAHWPLDGSGIDVSDNGLHGEVFGATPVSNRLGVDNNAYAFDGENDFIQLPNNPLLKQTFPFSISMWVYVDEFAEVTRTVFQNDEEDVYTGFWILYNSFGRISAGYGNGLGEAPFSRVTKFSDEFIETGEWNHIVANFNGLNDIDLYLNGDFNEGQYSGTAGSMVYSNEPGVIGRDVANEVAPYHDGSLDDIRYYNRPLTEDEIAVLFEGVTEMSCEAVEPSIWGTGPWYDLGDGYFVANAKNDAILVTGDGDLTVEIFEGDCNGTSIGIYNSVEANEIERVVVGDLIAGNSYGYSVIGGQNIQSKVKTYADSRIRENECGQSFHIDDQIHALRENELYANPAVQITGFTYRFEDVETLDAYEEVRNQVDGHTPQLSSVPGLQAGRSYNVQVAHRVLQVANGVVSEIYSDFGSVCMININSEDNQVIGCTDPIACNYDSDAVLDSGNCIYAMGNDECDGMGGIIDNPDIGDPCDDGDPNTINDVLVSLDECVGMVVIFDPICEDAIVIIGPGIYQDPGPSNGFDAALGCFSGDATHASWYSYTASLSGVATVSSSVDLDQPDTRVSIYTGECDELFCVASDDDSGVQFTSEVSFSVELGETYYIEWDDRWDDSAFDFILSVMEEVDEGPLCPTLNLPVDEALVVGYIDVLDNLAVDIGWSTASDANENIGSRIYLGTSPEDLAFEDEVAALGIGYTLGSGELGDLSYGVPYYWSVRPYNEIGEAVGCQVFSFVIVEDLSACPELNLFVGDPCDDGNPLTMEDVVQENCVCQGIALQVCADEGTLICDDFESYTLDFLTAQSDHWTTWTGAEGGEEDVFVTDQYANSGNKSMVISGTEFEDISLVLNNATTGKFSVSWNMLLPNANSSGYYDFQGSPLLGEAFLLQIFLSAQQNQGNGTVQALQGSGSFSYPIGEWFNLEHVIDLDNDLMTLLVDGEVILEGISYDGNLSYVHFYSLGQSNLEYFDDIVFKVADDLFCPDLNLAFGDECDDGNENTVGEIVNLNCECVGPFYDCPELVGNFGDDCNDGDIGTLNDMISFDCVCVGLTPQMNGNCSEAIEIGEGFFTSEELIDGNGYMEECDNFGGGAVNTAWYRYTPSMTGVATVSSEVDQAQPDTRVSIFIGDCDNLMCIDSDDDSGVEFTSLISFDVVEGDSYYIQWDDRWSTESFTFSVEVDFMSIENPSDDNFEEGGFAQKGLVEFGSKIYPNPQHGEDLFVEINSLDLATEKVTIEIYNAYGQRVHEEQFFAESSLVKRAILMNQELSSGMYFVKISMAETSQNHKLIIER